jgi:hypothetical protein
MKGVKVGDAVKVVYTGDTEVTKGDWEGESCHTMNVYVAQEGGVPSDDDFLDDDGEEEDDL